MTHFDSLPTAFSQRAQSQPKSSSAPYSDSGASFDRVWSAQEQDTAMQPTPRLPQAEPRPTEDAQIEGESAGSTEGLVTDDRTTDALPVGLGGAEPTVLQKPAGGGQTTGARLNTDVPPQKTMTENSHFTAANDASDPRLRGGLSQTRLQGPVSELSNAQVAGQQIIPSQRNAQQPVPARAGQTTYRNDAQRPSRQTTPSTSTPIPSDTTISQATPNGTPSPLDAGTQQDMPLDSELALTKTTQTQNAQQTSSTAAINRAYAPQVAQQITTAIVQSSGGTTEIMLNPEELGRVRIAMTAGDAGMTVTILTERPETADLMRRNIEHLIRELRDIGYDNPTFNFEDQRGDSGDGWGESARHSDAPVDLLAAEATPITPQHVALTGGLDLKL